MQGPNVKRLIAHKMSLLLIPPGGGFADGVNALTNPPELMAAARQATLWVEQQFAAVKACTDNPYPDDEAIAAAVLDKLKERKRP